MQHGCPYDCLESEIWRILLGRAAIFRAVRSRLWELWDAENNIANYGHTVRTALDNLYQTVDEVASIADSDRRTVSEVVGTWRGELSRVIARRRIVARAQSLLAELHHLVREAVDHDPFEELLNRVETKASAIYGTSWRDVSLSLGHTREHPRAPAIDQYGLGAVTRIEDDRAQVKLDIYPLGFGPAAYSALPYVLIHECVCHVPARQDKYDNRSEFAEGFLDWAAVFFFDRWMAELDNDLAPAAIEHAARLSGILKRETSATGAQRLRGHYKANLLAAWFQSGLPCSREQARAKVANLAIELNELEAPLASKDRFLSKVKKPLPGELEGKLRGWSSGETPPDDLL